jgi:hypothetical protein
VTHEIRERIVREATPEEKERRRAVRPETQTDLPELMQWAGETAAELRERLVVATVLTGQGTTAWKATDDYAAKHALKVIIRSCQIDLEGEEMRRLRSVSAAGSARCAYPCPGGRGSHSSKRLPSGSVAQPNRPKS